MTSWQQYYHQKWLDYVKETRKLLEERRLKHYHGDWDNTKRKNRKSIELENKFKKQLRELARLKQEERS